MPQTIHIIITGDATQIRTKEDIQALGLSPVLQEGELGEITKQKPDITYNTNRVYKNGKKAPDGIEIRFGTARPTEEVRQVLKDHGFQFSERQTMWYAIDNAQSRKLADEWTNTTIDVDTTQYVKHNFWARIKDQGEFSNLRDRTEFMVAGEPPQFFYNKGHLLKAYPSLSNLFLNSRLFFKKFYNKAVEENEESGNEANSVAIAEKLKALADGMQAEIDSKINSATSRQRKTAKRVRVAAGMREEGYRLQAIQNVLYALSNAHNNDSIYDFPHLQNIRNKSQVELLNFYTRFTKEKWDGNYIENQFAQNSEALQKLGITSVEEWSLAEKEKEALLQQPSTSQQQSNTEQNRRIKELEDEAWRMNIPGFFPTPRPLIDMLLDLADLKINQNILDPSAGKGDILDAVQERFPGKELLLYLYAAEINNTLREILSLKEYSLVASDFLDVSDRIFDRIVMNPPFENGQDTVHVTHALQLLNPGGRVVAIMSEGVFFRQFKRDKDFRELLIKKNAYVSAPIKEAFKNGFNSTNITVRIVAINEDGTRIQVPESTNETASDSPKSDDSTLLELEAQAELELLKMRLELQRKKNRGVVEGTPGVDLYKLQRFRQRAWGLQNDWEVLNFN